MKTMFLAAATVLTLSVGVAICRKRGRPQANSQFTEKPATLPRHRDTAPRQSRQPRPGRRFTFIPPSRAGGTWLFPAQDGGGANS